jgi:membrane protein
MGSSQARHPLAISSRCSAEYFQTARSKREQIGRLTANSSKLGFRFVFGLAVALWSANSGMKAIMDALNVVYKEKQKRGFMKLNIVSLRFTLAGIAVLLIALASVVVLPVALNFLGLHDATDQLLRLARWPLLIVIIVFGLSVLYRFGPSCREPRWQWISVGSVFAAFAGSSVRRSYRGISQASRTMTRRMARLAPASV